MFACSLPCPASTAGATCPSHAQATARHAGCAIDVMINAFVRCFRTGDKLVSPPTWQWLYGVADTEVSVATVCQWCGRTPGVLPTCTCVARIRSCAAGRKTTATELSTDTGVSHEVYTSSNMNGVQACSCLVCTCRPQANCFGLLSEKQPKRRKGKGNPAETWRPAWSIVCCPCCSTQARRGPERSLTTDPRGPGRRRATMTCCHCRSKAPWVVGGALFSRGDVRRATSPPWPPSSSPPLLQQQHQAPQPPPPRRADDCGDDAARGDSGATGPAFRADGVYSRGSKWKAAGAPPLGWRAAMRSSSWRARSMLRRCPGARYRSFDRFLSGWRGSSGPRERARWT